eukprot:1159605-Pelagomonas_calceolata.AAC.2
MEACGRQGGPARLDDGRHADSQAKLECVRVVLWDCGRHVGGKVGWCACEEGGILHTCRAWVVVRGMWDSRRHMGGKGGRRA